MPSGLSRPPTPRPFRCAPLLKKSHSTAGAPTTRCARACAPRISGSPRLMFSRARRTISGLGKCRPVLSSWPAPARIRPSFSASTRRFPSCGMNLPRRCCLEIFCAGWRRSCSAVRALPPAARAWLACNWMRTCIPKTCASWNRMALPCRYHSRPNTALLLGNAGDGARAGG